MGLIYRLLCLVSGKSYVGQTTTKLSRRLADHFKPSGSGCPVLSRAIKKYGRDAFAIEVLEENIPLAELDAAEKRWIAKLGTLAPGGYNRTPGGSGDLGGRPVVRGRRPSQKAIAAVIASNRRRTMAPTARAAFSKQWTPEAAARLVGLNESRVWTPEMRSKISAARRAMPLRSPKAACHPEKAHKAHGLCMNCYARSRREAA